MNQEISSVAIIGGGPAGATLACLLAKAGKRVKIFHSEKRPEIIVGESLIPALIPLLQEIGVEERIAAKSILKSGASLSLFPDELRWDLEFNKIEDAPATYAYNVPRDMFDATILARAVELGAELIPTFCKLKDCGKDLIGLPSGHEPVDFIVDATGRNRQLANLLKIDSQLGSRNDVALFAHLDKAELVHPGNLHINVLESGWSWRIPLPGKVSVGIVAPREYLSKFGANAETQYDQILQLDPYLAKNTASAKRITAVAKYSNYQLISQRMFGRNWAMLGDAAGFVDPIFSSGLFISMYSAKLLATEILENQASKLARYQDELKTELTQWQQLIKSFYDGRFFNLIRHANALDPKIVEHLQTGRTVGLLLSGFAYENRELLSSFEWILNFCQKFETKTNTSPPPTDTSSGEALGK